MWFHIVLNLSTRTSTNVTGPAAHLTYALKIPAGTKVTVNMWVKSLRTTNNAVTFTIKFGSA